MLAVALTCGTAYYLGSMRPGAQPSLSERAVPMVSAHDLRQEYERRVQEWRSEAQQLSREQAWLLQLAYEQMPAELVLYRASHEELSNLAKILEVSPATSPANLVFELRQTGSHTVATKVRGRPVDYEEVVADVASRFGAEGPLPRGSEALLERAAVTAALEKILANAAPAKRGELLAEIAKAQGVPTAVLLGASGALIAANLAGFGLYVGASTALGAVTGAMGITLPFVVYTGMSSVIAVAIGPVGWAVVAASAVIYQLGKPDYKKTAPGVLAIASVRARLIAERDAQFTDVTHRWRLLEKRANRLGVLRKFLVDIQRRPEQLVPSSTVPW